MSVLLVWDENPEEISMYLIDHPTPEQLDILNAAHGSWINAQNEPDQDAALDKLAELLDSEWKNDKLDINKEPHHVMPGDAEIKRVYLAGFMM